MFIYIVYCRQTCLLRYIIIVENMLLRIIAVLYAVHIFTQQICGLNFIELPGFQSDDNIDKKEVQEFKASGNGRRNFRPRDLSSTDNEDKKEQLLEKASESDSQIEYQPQYPRIRTTTPADGRKYWSSIPVKRSNQNNEAPPVDANDKDASLKGKIYKLVEQTLHDMEGRMETVNDIKEKNREQAPYKIGYVLNMVKKSRDVLNELFNVAVKHRDEWKALDQLKVFELIVHTNVDTTNLVRQLVEIHIQHLNASNSDTESNKTSKEESEVVRRRVVLL